MKWRVWVVVAVLGAAVVAGAFLLPHGSGSDSALAAAARATLEHDNFRTAMRTAQQTVAEDYRGPERLRITFDVQDLHGEEIVVGSTVYRSESSCPDTEGYTRHRIAAPRHGSGYAMLLSLASLPATHVDTHGGRSRYDVAFTPATSRTHDLEVDVTRASATVQRGRVRNATLVLRYRQGGKSATETTRYTFSRVGDVGPIVAPASSQVLPDDFVCQLGLTNTAGH